MAARNSSGRNSRIFDYIDIDKRVEDIKKKAIDDRKLFGQFLECFAIDERGFSINNYIIASIYDLEHKIKGEDYPDADISAHIEARKQKDANHIYWIGGNFSWNHLLCKETILDEFDNIATMIGHLDINYIHKEFDAHRNKVKHYYKLLRKLQDPLLKKHDIKTKIIAEYFDVSTMRDEIIDGDINNRPIKHDDITILDDENYKFRFYESVMLGLFKPPLCKMRLILDNSDAMQSGGVKFKAMHMPTCKMIINFIKELGLCIHANFDQAKLERIKNDKNYDGTNKYDGITIVEFTFEVITDDSFDEKHNKRTLQASNIPAISDVDTFFKTFREVYIETGDEYYESYDASNQNIADIRNSIKRLNERGMLAYSYLIQSDKKSNMWLNVDKYRQELFFKEKFYKGVAKPADLQKSEIYSDIAKYFEEELLIKYKYLYGNLKAYNVFFVEKLEHIVYKHLSFYFEDFVDFIDKWIVSRFRASVNTFIIDINKVLHERYGVILFVAGGDAMRRYDNDVSFTKDIDTKLYIGKILKNPERISQDVAHKLSADWLSLSSEQQKELILQDIINIIAEFIVNLRIHLERNVENILIKRTEITTDDGTINIRGVLDEVVHSSQLQQIDYNKYINYHFKTIIDTGYKRYRFRTREIRKTKAFPVYLYSLDMQTQLIVKIGGETEDIIYNHDISILDVVLQDDDEFDETFYKIAKDNAEDNEGVPVASLEFLLEDFYTTYVEKPDRALARVSSGKVKKDIERYNQLFKIYNIYLLQILNDNEKAKTYYQTFQYKIPEYFVHLFNKIIERPDDMAIGGSKKCKYKSARKLKGGIREVEKIVSVDKSLVHEILEHLPLNDFKTYFRELPEENGRKIVEYKAQPYNDETRVLILNSQIEDRFKKTFKSILDKIRDKKPFTIEDYIKVTELLKNTDLVDILTQHDSKLKLFLSDLAFYKKSLYNERLNILDSTSKWYIPPNFGKQISPSITEGEAEEYIKYLKLFLALVSTKTNKFLKNKISFFIHQITIAYKQYGIKLDENDKRILSNIKKRNMQTRRTVQSYIHDITYPAKIAKTARTAMSARQGRSDRSVKPARTDRSATSSDEIMVPQDLAP